MAMVAAAGPIANVVVALVFAIVYRAIRISGVQIDLVEAIVLSAVFYNFVLAILNLIPIPPLDGYNVLLAFLPPRYAFTLQRYAQYGFSAPPPARVHPRAARSGCCSASPRR